MSAIFHINVIRQNVTYMITEPAVKRSYDILIILFMGSQNGFRYAAVYMQNVPTESWNKKHDQKL